MPSPSRSVRLPHETLREHGLPPSYRFDRRHEGVSVAPMTSTRILTSLDAEQIAVAVETLGRIADAIDGSKVLKTRSEGRVKAGAKDRTSRLSHYWYVKGEATVVLHHKANDHISFLLEDRYGSRRIEVLGILPCGLSKDDCLDPRPVAAALDALHGAVRGADASAGDDRAVMLCEAIAERRPAGILRSIRMRSATPFGAGTLTGHDEEGLNAVRDTIAGRNLVLAELGRPVLLSRDAGQRISWTMSRQETTARSSTPDAITRLRLLSGIEDHPEEPFETIPNSKYARRGSET